MQVELFKPSEMNADFWQAFCDIRDASSAYDDPFFDPEFARIVGELRSDTYIGVGFDAGSSSPIAFWPMHVRPGGWARPIGGPFSDWHGPVTRAHDPVDPTEFLAAAGLAGFTAFGMPGHLSWGHLGERAGANMTDISAGWDQFLAAQSKLYPKHFKKIRRMERNLKRDFSEVTFNMNDTSRDAFDWLMSCKRQQFARTGRHDVLGPDWVQRLFETLRTAQSDRFSARLLSMRVDGKIVSAEFNLCSDRVMHGWITGFDIEYSTYSPGHMLQHEILKQMDHMDQTIYDSGIGLDYYKKYYTNFQLPVDTGVLRVQPRAGIPRLMADGWRMTEASMPGVMGRLMGKVRRRTDQIVMSEMTFGGRLSGLAKALKP